MGNSKVFRTVMLRKPMDSCSIKTKGATCEVPPAKVGPAKVPHAKFGGKN